jgi:hypothetical protein
MAITRIGAWTGAANTTGNTSWPTGTLDTTGGNFIVAVVTSNNALTSVTDNKSNAYTLLGPFNGAGGDNVYIAYTNNSVAATCGTGHIITANATGSTFFTISAAAYAGLATSAVLDKSAHANGTGTALASGSTTTTSQANLLLVGGGTVAAGSNFSWTAGSGYTLQSSVGTAATTGTGFLEDQLVSVAGAYSATATSGVSGGWDCAVAAFKDANPGSSAVAVGVDPREGTGPGVQPVRLNQFTSAPRSNFLAPNVTLSGQGVTSSAGSLAVATSIALTGQVTSTAQGTAGVSVSISLSGTSIGFTQGSLAVPVNASTGFVRQPGPGIGPFSNGQFLASQRGFTTAGGDVSVALSGQAASFAQGTLSPVISISVTGSSATLSQGTAIPAGAKALSGASIASAAGTQAPTLAVALSGQAATFAQGFVTTGSDVTRALTGLAVTSAQGSLVTDRSSSISGQSGTASAGSLSPGASRSLSGTAITAGQGFVGAAGDVTRALSGQSITVLQGTPIVGLPVPISSQTATVSGAGSATVNA